VPQCGVSLSMFMRNVEHEKMFVFFAKCQKKHPLAETLGRYSSKTKAVYSFRVSVYLP